MQQDLSNHVIRPIESRDAAQAVALMPGLADFDVPEYRNPDHLWQGDVKLFNQMLSGDAPDTHALVAVHSNGDIHGIAMYTMRNELLSGETSAHLEVLAVDPLCRRQGIGQALVKITESAAKEKGAASLTLHVFSKNTRARKLYASAGFNEELLRCYKPL